MLWHRSAVALPKKSIQSGTSRLVLGTRAPSPAMSAKRENSYSARRLRLSVLRTLRRARAPALPVLACLFLPDHFLGKAQDQTIHEQIVSWRSASRIDCFKSLAENMIKQSPSADAWEGLMWVLVAFPKKSVPLSPRLADD